MVKALFDTNIIIDFLNGREQAKAELARYADKAISVITWMEVMVGIDPENESTVMGFLAHFDHLPINEAVAILATKLRRKHKIKLPDAIIWATAQANGRILVSRNLKDFPPAEPGVRVPYTL